MPHQCVKCSKVYKDGTKGLLKGCSCGSKFFFYIKKDSLNKAKQINLTDKQKKRIEEDVTGILGDKIKEDQPIFLDFESINILKPGKFEIDIIDLFKGRPVIYKLEEGKYIIDLVSTFEAKDKSLKNFKKKKKLYIKEKIE